MTLAQYTALADDGCPNCVEHVLAGDAYLVKLPSGASVRVATVLRLETSPTTWPGPRLDLRSVRRMWGDFR